MAKPLGTALRSRRKALGMTQSAVANALKVSRAAVGQWEAGTHEPSTENLIAVCKLLQIDIEATVRGELASSLRKDVKDTFAKARSAGKKINIGHFTTAFQSLVDDLAGPGAKKIGLRLSQPEEGAHFFFMFKLPFAKVPCPKRLYDNTEDYCTIICNDFMAPKFQKNEPIYVSTVVLPRFGDFIIIKSDLETNKGSPTTPSREDAEICVMGRYVADDAESVTIEQFQPAQAIRIALNDRVRIERIYEPRELIEF